jgi:peroxiredoxin 2/4
MFNVLKINSKAPLFDLKGSQSGDIKQWKLEDFAGKWVVFFFYPADFTFVCPTEVMGFQELLPEFNKLNCEVVGCSVDSPFVHKAWAESIGGVDFPLLSDVHHSASIDYNVFEEHDAQSLRGTFIISPEGMLKWYCISDNNVGRNVEEVLRTVEALQTGKLCPVNWKKGQKTLN